jgi:hypothetical protein
VTGFEDLMAEPPGGFNHGRKRGSSGSWAPLEALDWETDLVEAHSGSAVPVPSIPGDGASTKRYVERPRDHGTRYTYKRLGCRCVKCRGWNAAQVRRQRNVAPRKDEGEKPSLGR